MIVLQGWAMLTVTRTEVFCFTGCSKPPRLRLLLEGGLASELLQRMGVPVSMYGYSPGNI